ncbi:hypothetical protein ACQ33O_07455 [Ferruginibacter sp. SUN002]|uniref:hypothetical protein n=1 Tax=Ferruginibacter sp. SUN002 TaxID=2937789 RepID=UPI003D35D7B8
MYRSFLVSIVCFISIGSFAQIQRTTTNTYAPLPKSDSAATVATGKSNKEVFKELDLTKEQRDKLKTIKKEAKSQKEAVLNNDNLKGMEKMQQLKMIKQNADAEIKKILTEEQWQKFINERKLKSTE